jgi:hypothetical protein
VVIFARANVVRTNATRKTTWNAFDVEGLSLTRGGKKVNPLKVQKVPYTFPASPLFNATPVETIEMQAVYPRSVVSPDTEIVVTYRTYFRTW